METLIGSGEHLSPEHMAVRSLIMFFIALILIRLGGLRIVGKKSGFDLVIVIMMGAVLARAIVGASDFMATIAAAVVMIVINRSLAWISIKSPVMSKLLKGKDLTLYKDGKMDWKNMNKACLSESDLLSSVRLETHHDNLKNIERATMETNGRISFILKPNAES